MSSHYSERIVVLSFLEKCEKNNLKKEQVSALISLIDIETLKFLLAVNLKEQGNEDFKKVIDFIKANKEDILNQLKQQNLFYSRINLALTVPALVTYGAILAVGISSFACPPLALSIAFLAGVAAVIFSAVTFDAIHENLQKSELYEKIGKKLETNYVKTVSFFQEYPDSSVFLNASTAMIMTDLGSILGLTGKM